MAFKITLQDFRTETITKGRNSYEKGTATYTYNGAQKTQTLMSFANPAVFATLKNAASGTVFVVETSKNDKGYDQWSSVRPEGEAAASGAPAKAGATTRVAGSNYETPEERKQRQLYIIKQSSISSAIEALTPGAKASLDIKQVLAVAQEFVDFVYGTDALVEKQGAEELKDVPY